MTYLFIALVFVLGINILPRLVGVIITSALAVLQVANIATWKKFGFPFEFGALQIVTNATIADAIEFARLVDIHEFLLLASVIALYALIVVAIFRGREPKRTARFYVTNLVLLALAIPAMDYFHKVRYDTYSYVHLYRMLFKYSTWKKEIDREVGRRLARLQERMKQGGRARDDTDDIVVVVLGESARRDHFSIYGYGRKTTPNLERRRNRLILFENAISSANSTVISLSLALSPATVGDLGKFNDTIALPGEARLAGYHVVWISNTDLLGRHTTNITLMAGEADELISTTPEGWSAKSALNDSLILPVLKSVLDRWRGTGRKLFIFLSTNGSHYIYRYRYPREFEKYKPVANKYTSYRPSEKQEIINEYDNSIYYTDYFLDQIMQMLERENRPATLVYFSDHGQRLYDDGATLGHGYRPSVKIEYRVPLLFWRTAGRRCENVERLARIKAERVSLQYLFGLIRFATCMTDDLPPRLYSPSVYAADQVMNYEELAEK